jgi:acetyl-CoA acetyltransferase
VFDYALKNVNASALNTYVSFVWNSDGAAALVLVSGKKAQELGLQVLARINGFADAAQVSCSTCFFSILDS